MTPITVAHHLTAPHLRCLLLDAFGDLARFFWKYCETDEDGF